MAVVVSVDGFKGPKTNPGNKATTAQTMMATTPSAPPQGKVTVAPGGKRYRQSVVAWQQIQPRHTALRTALPERRRISPSHALNTMARGRIHITRAWMAYDAGTVTARKVRMPFLSIG